MLYVYCFYNAENCLILIREELDSICCMKYVQILEVSFIVK